MKPNLVYPVVVAALIFCAPAHANDDLEKLENTARQFRELAERKAILASAEKDPAKKAELLASAGLLDQSAEATQMKLKDEKRLLADPAVRSARQAEAAAQIALAAAQEAVDRSRQAVAVAGNPKQNAENAERYMKAMSDYQTADESLAKAVRRKEAAERAVPPVS
jgi:hypothetical protein